MVVTSSDSAGTQIFGYLDYGLGHIPQDSARVFQAALDITADLSAFPPPRPEVYLWRIDWFLNLYTTGEVLNPRKFIGAYNRLNYGVIDFSFAGMGTGGEYWTYQSQRSQTYSCWSFEEDFLFPSSLYHPSPISSADMFALNDPFQPSLLAYASEASVLLISALAPNVHAQIYYQVQRTVGSNPSSYGFI